MPGDCLSERNRPAERCVDADLVDRGDEIDDLPISRSATSSSRRITVALSIDQSIAQTPVFRSCEERSTPAVIIRYRQ